MASQPSVELITPEESIERTVPREAPAHIKTRLSTIIYIYTLQYAGCLMEKIEAKARGKTIFGVC
jgi:hypothetical protein